MLFREPSRTQFDLNFSLLGFPVRVHPLFWLIGVLLGANLAREGGHGALLIAWIAALFVSILIHELGHALAMRYYGQDARIVLYWLGGLAIPESGYGSSFSRDTSNPWHRIVISAAGPVAGFLFALLVMGGVLVSGGHVNFYADFPIFWSIQLPSSLTGEGARTLFFLANSLLWINIFWGLVNLLPIYPLDGGQISRELCILNDAYTGVMRSIWISLIAALLMVVLAIYPLRDLFIGILFGSLAYSSYMMLQQFHGGGFGGGGFGGGGYRGGRPW